MSKNVQRRSQHQSRQYVRHFSRAAHTENHPKVKCTNKKFMHFSLNFQNGQIIHVASQRCLEVSDGRPHVRVSECVGGSKRQHWFFRLYRVFMPDPEAADVQALLEV